MIQNLDFIVFLQLEQLPTAFGVSKEAIKSYFIAFFHLNKPIATNLASNSDFIVFFPFKQLPIAFDASKKARKLHFITFFPLD